MAYLSEDISRLHSLGKTQKQIAAELQCGLNTVRRRMKELDLKAKSIGSRTFKLNEEVFEKIDSEDKAYWLGFLLADGCIAKSANTQRVIRVSLQERDEQHLVKLKKFFGYKGKLRDDHRKGHFRKILVFNSVKICNDIITMGWNEFKKNGDLKILDIDAVLIRHLVRGYFDGDGCLTNRKNINKTWQALIVSPHEAPLNFFAAASGVGNGEVRNHSSIKAICWSGRNTLLQFLDWLYKDATIYLQRKYARYQEFLHTGLVPYTYKSISSFRFDFNSTNDIIARDDKEDIINSFSLTVQSNGWSIPRYDWQADFDELRKIVIDDYIRDDVINNKPGKIVGNETVLHFQPAMWSVSQGKHPAITTLGRHDRIIRSAVRNFLLTPSKNLTCTRFFRELLFAGFTRASILPVGVIMAAIKKFNLSDSWFDPCAGWGNRLLAAHILGIDYRCTDPGISFGGLVNLKDKINSKAFIQNKKWQDADWQDCGFVLTSPPFWNKEDYLDNADYGTYSHWCDNFLFPLIDKCHKHALKTVLHVDKMMLASISARHAVTVVPIRTSNRKKMPTEYFVLIGDKIVI